jgi:hypothetical protein
MDAIVCEPTEQCHAPNPSQFSVVELKNRIESRAATSDEPSSTILHSAMISFSSDAASQLPCNDSILRTIRRQHQEAPANTNDWLHDHLRKTDRDENFVCHEHEKLIILTTKSNLERLKMCKHWLADGTFKVKALVFLLLLD